MKCLICENSENFIPLFPELCEVSNYICPECGFIFLASDESKQAYYKDDGYFKKSPNLGLRKEIISKGLLVSLAKDRIEKTEAVLGEKIVGMKVLDVGCGYGDLLFPLKEVGNKVLGIEPSPEATDIGKNLFDVEIAPVLLEEFTMDYNFDLILCNHTLEHVDEPILFLNKLKSLLAPEGILYIEVPNVMRPTGNFTLSRFFYEEHLSNFSTSTLYALLEKSGFKVVNYDDKDFLRFTVSHTSSAHPGKAAPSPAISADEILAFLRKYKKNYNFLTHLKVYFQKFRYLLKVLRFKILK